MQVFDSNGPDVRIRGTAHQVAEKYEALSKDAASSGDIVLAQSYLQHAEHYLRVINGWESDVRGGRDQAREDSGGERQNRRSRGPQRAKQEDDLSLPSSILGVDSKVKSEEAEVQTRTAPESAGAEKETADLVE